MNSTERKWLMWGSALMLGALALFGSYFTVSNGHEGVVTRFGMARYQVTPGLHFKVPLIDSVEKIDMREQTNKETLAAGTYDRLPVTVKMSQTWKVKDGMALEFFVKYGTKQRFEDVILDRRFLEAGKGAISGYDAVKLLRDRQLVSQAIDKLMVAEMANYPIVIIGSQIEDIEYPSDYLAAVKEKEKAREEAAQQEYKLQTANTKAMEKVGTAQAEAQATELNARAQAAATTMRGEAEAGAARLMADAIAKNPQLVAYEYAKRWNGVMPGFVPAGNAPMLMQIPVPKQ